MVLVVPTASLIHLSIAAFVAAVGSILLIILCAKKQTDDSGGVVRDGKDGVFERRCGSHLEEPIQDGKAQTMEVIENENRRGSMSPSVVLQMERRSSSQLSQQSGSSHSSRRNPGDALPVLVREESPSPTHALLAQTYSANSNSRGKELNRKTRSKTMPVREQKAPYDTSDGSDETYARVQDVARPAENAYLVVDLKGKEEQYELVNSELKRKRRAASSPEAEIAAVVSNLDSESEALNPEIFDDPLPLLEVSKENSGDSGVYAIVVEDKQQAEKSSGVSRFSKFKRSRKKSTRASENPEKEAKRKGSKKFTFTKSSPEHLQADNASPPPPVPPLKNLKLIAQEQRKSVLHSMSDDESRSLNSICSTPATPLDSPQIGAIAANETRRPSRPIVFPPDYEPVEHSPLLLQDDGISNPYMVVTEDLRAKSLERLDQVGLDSVDMGHRRDRLLTQFESRGRRLQKRFSVPLSLEIKDDVPNTSNTGNVEDLYAKVDMKQKEADRRLHGQSTRVCRKSLEDTFYMGEKHREGADDRGMEEGSKSLPTPSPLTPCSIIKHVQLGETREGRLQRVNTWSPYCTVDAGSDVKKSSTEGMYATINDGKG